MLVIVLMLYPTTAHNQCIGVGAAPGAVVAAQRVVAGRPRVSPPYVGYWPAGAAYAQAQWYVVHRDRTVIIAIPNVTVPNLFSTST